MGKLAVLMLTGLMFAAPAAEGALYRCVGADGIPNYSSKRVSNAVCKSVSTGAGASRVSRSSASNCRPPSRPSPCRSPRLPVGPGAIRRRLPPAPASKSSSVPRLPPRQARRPRQAGRPGSCAARSIVRARRRHPLYECASARRGAVQAALQLRRDLLRLRPVARRELRHRSGSTPSAYSSEIRDAASRFGVDESHRPGHHPCRIRLSAQRAFRMPAPRA